MQSEKGENKLMKINRFYLFCGGLGCFVNAFNCHEPLWLMGTWILWTLALAIRNSG
jgi:hypothetical protein